MLVDTDSLALAPGVALDRGRLADQVRGAAWPLNASGAFVLCRAGVPVGQVVGEIADAFSLPPEAARGDLLRFAWRLNALALVNIERGETRWARLVEWLVLAVRLAPAGAFPAPIARRRALDTRSVPRAVASSLGARPPAPSCSRPRQHSSPSRSRCSQALSRSTGHSRSASVRGSDSGCTRLGMQPRFAASRAPSSRGAVAPTSCTPGSMRHAAPPSPWLGHSPPRAWASPPFSGERRSRPLHWRSPAVRSPHTRSLSRSPAATDGSHAGSEGVRSGRDLSRHPRVCPRRGTRRRCAGGRTHPRHRSRPAHVRLGRGRRPSDGDDVRRRARRARIRRRSGKPRGRAPHAAPCPAR